MVDKHTIETKAEIKFLFEYNVGIYNKQAETVIKIKEDNFKRKYKAEDIVF